MAQVNTLSENMKAVVTHVSCLPSIERLMSNAVENLSEVKDGLMAAATNKDHVPLNVVMSLVRIFMYGMVAMVVIFLIAFTVSYGVGISTPWVNVNPGAVVKISPPAPAPTTPEVTP